MQPTTEDLKAAFNAGFQAIDEGKTFYEGFGAYLEAAGYRRVPESPCTCSDGGAHGHLPECRWLRAPGQE